MSSAELEQDDNLLELQLANDNFDKTLPQVLNVSKLLTKELHLIETKEKQLGERFKSQLHEYKKVSTAVCCVCVWIFLEMRLLTLTYTLLLLS